jgi:hypothetical protein
VYLAKIKSGCEIIEIDFTALSGLIVGASGV